MSSVDWCVILHKDYLLKPGFREFLVEAFDIGPYGVPFFKSLLISLHYHNIRASFYLNRTLDYDANVFSFRSRIYYFLIPFLLRGAKAPSSSGTGPSFEGAFIAKYNAFLIDFIPILIKSSKLKSFFCMNLY